MLYIGVDLGTSAVKLLYMYESAKVLNIVSKEYPISFPKPGWSEQNPEDWFTQSVEGMKELTEGIDRSQVAGIGFGGQMHGLVMLDEIKRKIEDAENSKKLLEQNELSDKIKLKDFLGIQKFDTEKLREIIKVIRVHSQDEIEIEWNFDDIFSE